MISKKLLFALAAALMAVVLSAPPRVNSQQNPPCAKTQTAGKTDKQIQLEDCSCEQSVAQDKPSYRVGAAPFGRKAALRVGRSAAPGVGKAARVGGRRGAARSEPEDLYDGLEVPDLKDLRSPEVVGLREKVLRAREEARQKVGQNWQRLHDTLQLDPDNYFATRKLKDRRFLKAYERFNALQNSGQWVSWPTFDWREQGLDVGPVLHQGACQSCWAFAAMSVYQSSWNLEQMRLGAEYFEAFLPGVDYWYRRIPSVQQLLNCIGKEKGDCESGGWHGTAFAFMVNTHVPHIADRVLWKKGDRARIEEYTGRLSPCTDTLRGSKVKRGGIEVMPLEGPDSRYRLPANSDQILTAYDRALAWGYVNDQKPDQLPSVAQLKQALIEHGPLAMPIHGDACFSLYQGGVFNGRSAGDVTHVMVLIGWDDDKGAWLIKNSWGEEWGEKGFCWVAYGSNDVGKYAAWIQPTPATEEQR